MNNNPNGGGGIGVLGLLGVAFVVLKLTGNITWSWLWVLAPFWIPLAIIAVLLLCVFLVSVLSSAFKN